MRFRRGAGGVYEAREVIEGRRGVAYVEARIMPWGSAWAVVFSAPATGALYTGGPVSYREARELAQAQRAIVERQLDQRRRL